MKLEENKQYFQHIIHLFLFSRKIQVKQKKTCAFYARQENARLHISLVMRQKWLQLGCEVLTFLPYSTAMEPLDYHLFGS